MPEPTSQEEDLAGTAGASDVAPEWVPAHVDSTRRPVAVVTGATGHVGNNLVRTLLARGYDVRALYLHERSVFDNDPLFQQAKAAGHLRTQRLDIRNVNRTIRACRGADVVFHGAAIIDLAPSPARERQMWQVNVRGTENVIAATACARACFVHMSSVHVYEHGPEGIDPDRTPLVKHPGNPYEHTKREAHRKVLEALREGSTGPRVRGSIAVLGGMYGGNDYLGSDLGWFLSGSVRFAPMVDGAYAFAHLPPVCEAMVNLADSLLEDRSPGSRDVSERGGTRGNSKAHNLQGQTFLFGGSMVRAVDMARWARRNAHRQLCLFIPMTNRPLAMSTGVSMGLAAVMKGVCSVLGVTNPMQPEAIKVVGSLPGPTYVNSSKAERMLGYRPADAEQAVTETVRWYQEHPRKGSAGQR